MIFNENEKVVLECDIKKWNMNKIRNLDLLLSQKMIQIVLIPFYDFDKNILTSIVKKYPYIHFYTPYKFETSNHTTYLIFENDELDNGIDDIAVNIQVDLNKHFNIENFNLNSTMSVFVEFVNKSNFFDLKNYMQIMKELQNSNHKILLSSLFKYTKFLKEHPCNMYLCSNKSCHSNKSNVPRYLYWHEETIYPYKVKSNRLKIIEETYFEDFESYIQDKYLNSNEHRLFIELNKGIFKNYVMNNFITVLPWNLLLQEQLFKYERY